MHTICHDSEDESNDGDIDPDHDIDELELGGCYDDAGSPELEEWFTDIKRDPLMHAHRVIHLLHSSDNRRNGFRTFIIDGNECNWFSLKTGSGKRELVKVPALQPLRDVKTRWDSVYMMLQHLRVLWSVSLSWRLCHTKNWINIWCRLLISILRPNWVTSLIGNCWNLIGIFLKG